MRRAWIINSYHLPPSLARLLRGLRDHYPRDEVVVINDGDMERDGEYRRLTRSLDVGYYNDGERLKVWPRGGEWLLRALRVMSDIGADLYIRLDDDCEIRRAVDWHDDVDVQAIAIDGRALPFTGQVVAIRRDALARLLRDGDFLAPRYHNTFYRFPTDSIRHSDVELHWTDAILNREVQRLELSFRHLACAALRSQQRDAAIVVDNTWICEVCRARGIAAYERALVRARRA